MITPTQFKIIKSIKDLSDNYHKLSFLAYELSRSLEYKCNKENMTNKEFKEYLKNTHFKDKINGFEDMLK